MRIKIKASHLSPASIKNLKKESHNISFQFTPHSLRRLGKWHLTTKSVRDAIQEGEIIEYHTLQGNRRVLFRDADGVCAVADLDDHKIITVYKNTEDDKHLYINKKPYIFGV